MPNFQVSTTTHLIVAILIFLACSLRQHFTIHNSDTSCVAGRGTGTIVGDCQQEQGNGHSSDKKETERRQKEGSSDGPTSKENGKSRSLFDGKSLDGWESIEFGGEGDILVADGEIQMLPGDPLTGICVIDGTELPTVNYEVSLKGVKRGGHDFFCGLTFPVKDNFCTLILGGWGGSLVGLSNLDGRDASENGTKVTRKFKKNQWYDIRVRVLPERITVWIDKEQVIDESIKDREVSIRNDVITTTPLGITNFITESAFKDIRIRLID